MDAEYEFTEADYEEAAQSSSTTGAADSSLRTSASALGSSQGAVSKANSGASFDEHLAASEHILSSGRRARPAAQPMDSKHDALVFQQIEIDQYVAQPHKVYSTVSQSATVLRVFGVTDAGNSVAVHVHGFLPYMYASAPRNMVERETEAYRQGLDAALRAAFARESQPRFVRRDVERDENDIEDDDDAGGGHAAGHSESITDYVLKVEMLQRTNVYGFHQPETVLKITFALPKHVPRARTIVQSGFRVPGHEGMIAGAQVFECDMPFVLRFMIDRGIVGGNWLELPAARYTMRADREKQTSCQYEADIAFDDVISHQPDGDWQRIAPLRILSFDIECAAEANTFPKPERDPVITVANYVTIHGEAEPIVRMVLTLNTCSSIAGAEVIACRNEAELLRRWRQFVMETDPDVLIGYNITNFDLPYLVDRANALNIGNDFCRLSRVLSTRTVIKSTRFSSKAYGTRENKSANIDGRVQFDLLQMIQRDYKLSSYSLNSVSAHFLGEQKEDVQHSIITDLFRGTADTRRRLAVYCLKDAYLPQRLLDRLMGLVNYMEMARVTGVPMSFLLSRGQQIKVISQLYRAAQHHNMIIPFMSSQGSDDKYEGAIVIEPKKGFYDIPIATLDFASLYPSIMMAHNLCYTTLLSESARNQFQPADFIRTPNGDYFLKASVRKGLLPAILEDLLAARKRAREDLKKETDPARKAVLDGRQLALKVSANSVYGFTGATVGKLPCLAISSSVTAFGRTMIEHTKAYVEEHFTIAKGYPADAVVVYGDTDSVMVKFGVSDVAEAMKLGQEAAARVTETFVKPINLTFEKVYYPYLLMNKKRYAGLWWSTPKQFDKLDAKGIETVRRDNCLLVRKVINTVLQRILIDKNVDGAVEYVKGVIADLLQNKLDLSLLVISKSLAENYKNGGNSLGHVVLARKMQSRDEGSAPHMGDRVQYVIVKGPKGAKTFEKTEDPIYVLEKNLPLDTQYYLDNQLAKPLMRLFEPVMENPQTLLSGDHTRTIAVPVSTQGALVKFAVRTITCLSCKAPLKGDQRTVCDACADREGDVYQQTVAKVAHFESLYAQAWTQCQRCQGALHQDVLCTSRDCPIFYMRKKVQKDLSEAQTVLDRFGVPSW